ncbi:MAG: carboxypeptidase regulatory-like domain-containing protein [Acidimicrobiia bacterium]
MSGLRYWWTRLVMVVAVAAAVGSLVWRAGWSLAGVSWWFGGAGLAVEVLGVALSGLLVFSLWPSRGRATRGVDGPADDLTTIVVVGVDASVDDLHASLLGAREVRAPHRTVLVVGRADTETFALAARLDAEYATVDERALGDVLERVRADVDSPYLLVVRAGDVVMPDVLDRLHAERDRSTGMVQARLERANADALVGLRDPKRAAQFDNVCGAALGSRGVAPWAGTGALFSTVALDTAGGFATGPGSTELRTVVRLHRAGYTTRFCDRFVIETSSPPTLDRQLADRRARAVDALGVLRSAESPLRARHLPWRARIAAAAGIGRYLPGVYHLGFVAVLTAAVLLGAVPLHATWQAAATFWFPAHVLMTVAVLAGAHGALRLGDRTRTGLRSLGVDTTALAATFGIRGARPRGAPARGTWSNLRALTAAMVVLDAAIVARFASGILELGLPRFDTQFARVLVLGAAALTVAHMITVLHLAGRHRRLRASRRVPLDVDVHFEEHLPGAHVLDISTSGIGVVFPPDALTGVPEPGDPIGFSLALPTLDGRFERLSVYGDVVTTTALADGSWRVGLTYGDTIDRDAIIVFCRITHPTRAARIAAGTAGDLVLLPAELHRRPEPTPPRRPVLRAVNTAAVLALLGTMTPTAAFAATPGTATISGTITLADTGAPAAGAQLRLDRDNGFTTLAVTTAGSDGTYSFTVNPVDTNAEYSLFVYQPPSGYAAKFSGVRYGNPVTYHLADGEDHVDNFTLDRWASVTGRLVDGSGSPIAGEHLWVQGAGWITTNGAGVFSATQITPWDAAVAFGGGDLSQWGWHSEYGRFEAHYALTGGHETDLGDITLRKGGITGTVVDSQSAPVAGLAVTADGGHDTTTGADGTFTVTGLDPTTTHTLHVAGGADHADYDQSGLTVNDGRDPTNIGNVTVRTKGGITGTVVDAQSTPIAGLTVTADGGRDTTTGADGAFTVTGLDPTTSHSLHVAGGADHLDADQSGLTVNDGPSPTNIGNVTVHRKGGITGTVVDAQSTPIAGLTVTADGGHDTTTGADGAFTVTGLDPTTSHSLHVAGGADHLDADQSGLNVADGPDPTSVGTITLGDPAPEGTAVFYGTVTSDGSPVAGATVTALDSIEGGAEVGSATTDGDGRYRITGLPVDRGLAVVASKATYVTNTGWGNTTNRGVTQVDVTLQSGAVAIHGRVTTSDGDPAVGVHVDWNSYHAVTDAHGDYRIDGLPPHQDVRPVFANTPDGFSPETYNNDHSGYDDNHYDSLSLRPGQDRTVNVTLERWGHVTGRVVDAAGNPVAGAAIRINDWPATPETTSGPDGTFRLAEVPPGLNHPLDVTMDGHPSRSVTLAYVPVDGTLDVGDVTLDYAAITARVVDDHGDPVPSHLDYAVCIGWGDCWHYGFLAGDGRILIDHLSPDTLGDTVRFYLWGNDDYTRVDTTLEHVTLHAGQTTDLGDVTVHRKGTLTGRLVDGDGNPVSTYVSGGNDSDSGGGWSGPDGRFSFRVPPGTIHVTTSWSQTFADLSTDVTVEEWPAVTDMGDVVLSPWSHVTGTVTGDGAPVAGITVTAVGTNYSATTAEDGTYDLKVPAGTHHVRFGDTSNGIEPGATWDPQVWDGRPSDETGDPVVVGTDATVTGISATLRHRATLSGTITDSQTGEPVPNACVVVVWGADGQHRSWGGAMADADGRYTLAGVASGTVYVLAADADYIYCGENFDPAHQPTFYGGIPAPAMFDGGDPAALGAVAIPVDTRTTTELSGLDIALLPRPGATFTVHLRDAAGNPTMGYLYLATEAHYNQSAFDAIVITDENGDAVVHGVPNGTVYAIGYVPDGHDGEIEWWNDHPFSWQEQSPYISPQRDHADGITIASDGHGGFTYTTGCYTGPSLEITMQAGPGNPHDLACNPTTTTTTTSGPTTTTTHATTTTAAPTTTAAAGPGTTTASGPGTSTATTAASGPGSAPAPSTSSDAAAVLSARISAQVDKLGVPKDSVLRKLHPSSNLTTAPAPSPEGIAAQLPAALRPLVFVGGDRLATTGRARATGGSTGGPGPGSGGGGALLWTGAGAALAAAGAGGMAFRVRRRRRPAR